MNRKKPSVYKKLLLPLLSLCVGFGCYFASLVVQKANGYTLQIGEPSAENAGQSLRLYCIDIGQGDALLAQQGDHWALLDTGAPDEAEVLFAFLETQGVEHLDYLIISHMHADHMGGAARVLQQLSVDSLILPQPVTAEQSNAMQQLQDSVQATAVQQPVYAQTGAAFSLGNATVRILSDGTAQEDENESSLVCLLQFDCFSVLAAGDSGEVTEQLLMKEYSQLQATVFKVSHHGSATSNGEAFLQMLRPRIALISCAAENDYGHPHSAVLERLERVGAKVFRTDTDGTVTVTVQDGLVEVRTQASLNRNTTKAA